MSDLFLAGEILDAHRLNSFVQAGSTAVVFSDDTVVNGDIDFPAPYVGAPTVGLTVVRPTVGTAVFVAQAGSVTGSGCEVRVLRADSSTPVSLTVEVHWTAVGVPA